MHRTWGNSLPGSARVNCADRPSDTSWLGSAVAGRNWPGSAPAGHLLQSAFHFPADSATPDSLPVRPHATEVAA